MSQRETRCECERTIHGGVTGKQWEISSPCKLSKIVPEWKIREVAIGCNFPSQVFRLLDSRNESFQVTDQVMDTLGFVSHFEERKT